jgi:glycosyltransferase involved in cell wall biosynthesis
VIKIVHLTPLYFDKRSCVGGGERYPLTLARGIVEAGRGRCTVELMSYDAEPQHQTLQPGVTWRLLKAANRSHPLRITSWEVAAALADADLVHIHQAAMRASEIALLAAKQQRKLVCLTDHGSLTSGEGTFSGRLELADRLICYSDYGRSLLQSRTPVTIIKGGVDTDYFTPPPQPPARDSVLYVGRLVPYKSVDQLIRALPAGVKLTVCGRPYHDAYFSLLKQLAAGKRVEFVLDADDTRIRQLYQQALVTVLPTRYEDCWGNPQPAPELMGLTLLEAMACGTPVLCFRAGAMPEFVRHGETGYVYDNLEALNGHLRSLAADRGLAAQLGQQARQMVVQEFDYRVVGAKLLAVYEGLLAQRKRVAA